MTCQTYLSVVILGRCLKIIDMIVTQTTFIAVIGVTMKTSSMNSPQSYPLLLPMSASPTSPRRPGTISMSSCQSLMNAQSGLAARLFCCLGTQDNNTKEGHSSQAGISSHPLLVRFPGSRSRTWQY